MREKNPSMRHTSHMRKTLSADTPPQRVAGYTLQELLTTLAIGGVLTMGSTGLYKLVDQQRKTTALNDLVALLSLARSEAIRRRCEVVVCPSSSATVCDSPVNGSAEWHRGMMLFADENNDGDRDPLEPVIRADTDGAPGITIKSSAYRAKVTFQPNGLSSGSTTTLTVCGANRDNQPKYIVVANTGRTRVATAPPDGKADEPLELCP